MAIAVSVGALAWAGPSEATSFTRGGSWAVGIAIVLTALAPFALRVVGLAGGLATSIVAGLGWACVGLATALAVSGLSDRRWLVAVGWGVAVALASGATLLAEMTALQTWPATRSIPVVFGLEMALPAALAPLLAESASPPHRIAFGLALVVACAGAAVLGELAERRQPANGLGDRANVACLQEFEPLVRTIRGRVTLFVAAACRCGLRRCELRSGFAGRAVRHPGRRVVGVRPGDARPAAGDVQAARCAARPLHASLERDRRAAADQSGLAARSAPTTGVVRTGFCAAFAATV